MEYDDALDDAFDTLPEHDAEAGSRLSVPDPEGETDGSFTRLTNVTALADALGREPDHQHTLRTLYTRLSPGHHGQEYGTHHQ